MKSGGGPEGTPIAPSINLNISGSSRHIEIEMSRPGIHNAVTLEFEASGSFLLREQRRLTWIGSAGIEWPEALRRSLMWLMGEALVQRDAVSDSDIPSYQVTDADVFFLPTQPGPPS